MKKAIILVLALVLVIGTMAGCTPSGTGAPSGTGGKTGDNSGGGSTPPTNSTPGTSSTTTPSGTTSAPGDKPLVGNAGDTASYGTYNGKSIVWQCVAVDTSDEKNQKALLVSTEIVSYWVFNAENKEVTWETSTIRGWLNGDFYNAIFTAEQKAKILESDIENKANLESGIGGGANTKDRVFLLSLDEATRYFASDSVRSIKYNATQAEMEALAKAISDAGVSENWSSKFTYDNALADLKSYNGTTDKWWLRTSGRELGRAANIAYDGSLNTTGEQVYQLQGVRPAIWVDITPKQ